MSLLNRKPGEGEYLQGNDRYEGFSKDLMQGIASHIGFRYEIKVVSGNGNKDPVTKKWDGLVKELLDRVSDNNIFFYFKKTPAK